MRCVRHLDLEKIWKMKKVRKSKVHRKKTFKNRNIGKPSEKSSKTGIFSVKSEDLATLVPMDIVLLERWLFNGARPALSWYARFSFRLNSWENYGRSYEKLTLLSLFLASISDFSLSKRVYVERATAGMNRTDQVLSGRTPFTV